MDGKPFGCRRPLSAVSLSVQEIATDECSNLSVQKKVGQNRQKPTGRNRGKKHDETNSIFRKGVTRDEMSGTTSHKTREK